MKSCSKGCDDSHLSCDRSQTLTPTVCTHQNVFLCGTIHSNQCTANNKVMIHIYSFRLQWELMRHLVHSFTYFYLPVEAAPQTTFSSHTLVLHLSCCHIWKHVFGFNSANSHGSILNIGNSSSSLFSGWSFKVR